MTDKKTVSGFDMRPTLEWYFANLDAVARNIPVVIGKGQSKTLHFPFCTRIIPDIGSDEFHFDAASLAGIAQRMPPRARARSNLQSVTIRGPLWFLKDSTGERPTPTSNVDLAMSPTSVIPSYVEYRELGEGEPGADRFGFGSHVNLYRMPGIGMTAPLVREPDKLRPVLHRVVWVQAFLHELWHTVVTPALYGGPDERKLELLDRRIVDEHDYLMGYVALAERFDPISHYASAYSNKDGSLKADDHGQVFRSLSEHIVEALTAIGLHFAFRIDGNGLDPFKDRKPMYDYLVQFMHARWVEG